MQTYSEIRSGIDKIENDNQWGNESNGDDSEYIEQNNQLESLNSIGQIPINNRQSRKKAKSQIRTEAFNRQIEEGENVVSFVLRVEELTKLTAISILLGYEDISLFAKDLVNKGVEPYFELASRTLKSQHFNGSNE